MNDKRYFCDWYKTNKQKFYNAISITLTVLFSLAVFFAFLVYGYNSLENYPPIFVIIIISIPFGAMIAEVLSTILCWILDLSSYISRNFKNKKSDN